MTNSKALARLWIIVVTTLAIGLERSVVIAQDDCTEDKARALLWSSTGGGWRAMFADIGYANMFQKAGLFDETSTKFESVSTVSGASWFSTQLFYSQEFYRRTVLAQTAEELETFVIDWMETYADVSDYASNETKALCKTEDLDDEEDEEEQGAIDRMKDMCELLVENDQDWAFFIQKMLRAASTNYDDPGFVDRIANPENRIESMQNTDLLIQTALMPNSRVRETSTSVYLGYQDEDSANDDSKLFAVALSAAWVVTDDSADFWYNTEDLTDKIQTYIGPTPEDLSWGEWDPFFLYPGTDGTVAINTSDVITINKKGGPFQPPFAGPEATTVLQVAASSSAAEGGASPLIPSAFTQRFSIRRHSMEESKTPWYYRVLAGIASGLLAAAVVGCLVYWWQRYRKQEIISKSILASGASVGVIVGLLVGFFYGLGSIALPVMYNMGIGRVYKTSLFDKVSVCTQWPNACGEKDGHLVDGYYIDNPAVVINVGNYIRKNGISTNETLKLIVTNTNGAFDAYAVDQLLQYFSTTFNENVDPGDFVWVPGQYSPNRSPQIFEEYLDKDGLFAKLEPISGSNMTTARMQATTVDNPAFGTLAGQPVDILLLNLNQESIPVNILGEDKALQYTLPLAEMTKHVGFNEELVKRVEVFVDEVYCSVEP